MLFGRRPSRLNLSKSLSRVARSYAESRAARSRAVLASAADSAAPNLIEKLENRVLLTTLSGPGQGLSRTFEYVDAKAQVVRIVLQGDITAEFIGVRPITTNPNFPATSSRQFVPAVDTAVNLVTYQQTQGTNAITGVDLYAIYVSKADINSSISIAMVPPPSTDPNAARKMMPFAGNSGNFTITNGRTGVAETVASGENTGSIILGARTNDTNTATTLEQDIAISSVSLKSQFGVRPASAKGRLDAGLVVAPGVSLGQFLFGGTVTGVVSIGGSMNLFYAGSILTGDLTGQIEGTTDTRARNFTVAGDLRELVTMGSIGTDKLTETGVDSASPDLFTGTDIRVSGRVGEIVTKDAYVAALSVTHDPKVRGPGTDQHELEVRDTVPAADDSDTFFQGDPFSDNPARRAPSLGDSASFNNDTPATAQFLGTSFASNVGKGTDDVIHLDGELYDAGTVTDRIDYYAVSLLAGQTIQLKTTTRFIGSVQQITLGSVATGLIDPEGRVVASDYSNGKDVTERFERPFRFTAKEPGVYHIAIDGYGDSNFDNQVDDGELPFPRVSRVDYTLDVSHISDIALGGIVAASSIGFIDTGLSVDVANGDIGAIISTGGFTGSASGQNAILSDGFSPITVRNGNLRDMEATSIGLILNQAPNFGVDLSVPKGTVGLLRGTGADITIDTVDVNPSYFDSGTSVNPSTAVGFDYQLVDAAGSFDSNIIADRAIGVIRAQSIGTDLFAPRIAANADSRGNDGVIDEIDCVGSFGTLQAGGPQISVGPGGNVRYLHADNPNEVFRDQFFGRGEGNLVTVNSGQYNYVDDSGTPVTITQSGGTVTGQVGVDPDTGVGTLETQTVSTALQVLTYGIRGSGGSVLMYLGQFISSVLTTTSGTITGTPGGEDLLVPTLLEIDTGRSTGSGTAEIGEINTTAVPGATVTFHPTQVTTTLGNLVDEGRSFSTGPATIGGSSTATVLLRGRRTLDVFDVVGASLNNVENDTDGEVVNLNAQTLGTLSAQSIGVGKSKTGTEIQRVDIQSDVFPFNAQRSLISVGGGTGTTGGGDVISIRARRQLGNISAAGTIGTIQANSDKRNEKAYFEGIVGPVVAGGNMLSVDIGEGLATSGTGEFEQGGLFASGTIVSITNQGGGSDIRGDIVTLGGSLGGFTPFGSVARPVAASTGVGTITLSGGGSIIDADIFSTTSYQQALEIYVFPRILVDTVFGNINISDGGGIIGSDIGGTGLGQISIKHGFGVIDSSFDMTGLADFTGIDTDGYGIRSCTFDGGFNIGRINVRGDGKVITTEGYTSSVRESERGIGFESGSGEPLGDYNDLHTFLGTTAAKPKNTSTSISGEIDDTIFSGAQNLGSLAAYNIRGTDQSGDPTMRISFAQSVGYFLVTNLIDGLDFTAGTVNQFQAGKDISNTNFTATGLVNSLVSGGNIKASTNINVEGTDGRIKTLTTKRALFGSVQVGNKIDTLNVGTDFGSKSFNSSNDIGVITIDGSILGGSSLRAADQIASLNVGKNINEGATVRAKRISAQHIKGAVRGNIITG